MIRKRCGKGNPCGYACIEKADRCIIELGPDVSSGVGKVAKSVSSMPTGSIEGTERFIDHVTKNTLSLPNTNLSSKDLANSVAQAYGGLTGEAKVNLGKAMSFVVKDGQSAVISLSRLSYERNAIKEGGLETHSSWVKSPEFKRVMQWAYKHEYNPLYAAGRLNVKLEDLKIKEEEIIRKIDELTRSGRNPKSYDNDLLNTRKKMREIKQSLKNPDYFIANLFLGKEGLQGFTNPMSRQVVIMGDEFDKGRPINVKSLSKGIEETMGRRAQGGGLSPEDQLKTFHISGLGAKGPLNERVLSTYLHELGHQVHYRSGIEDPPTNSISLKRKMAEGRGLSGYSNAGPREVFAEAFVAFTLNPSALKKYDEPLYDWVSRNMNVALRNVGLESFIPPLY